MTATSNVIDEEKMGIVLQEICGNRHGDIFYPTLSGVARSINYYPIGSEKAEDGIVNVAFGLGKLIVDGGLSLRFSPKHPKKILQLTSPDAAIKETQKEFYALDLNTNSFVPSPDDGINILRLNIKDITNDGAMKFVASTYDLNNNVLYDGINRSGKKIITFSNILQHKLFPLADVLKTLLEIGQEEMNNPIEIEFAANLETAPGTPKIFNFLQIRPIVQNDQSYNFNIDRVRMNETIIFSDSALGNGLFKGIKDLVYVKPDSFNASHSEKIAVDIEKINIGFVSSGTSYVLIGPGRWGSSDPRLGIPVKWPQISAARLIVEAGLKNYRIDPSQGTHFFQNVTSFRVGYFTINPFINEGYYNVEYLDKLETVFEDDYVRHIRFNLPLDIMIDGKRHKGVIMKPVN